MADSVSGLKTLVLKREDRITAGVLAGIGLAVLCGVLYGGYLLMPMMVDLAKNTIIFFAELAVLVFMALAALQVWTQRDLFTYKFQNFARNLRRRIVADDPIGTLDTAINRMDHKREEISQALTDSKAAQKRLQNRVKNNNGTGALDKAEAEEQLALSAKAAHRPETEVAQHAVAADRWRRQAAGFEPMLKQLGDMQSAMDQAFQLADSSLADLKNQREVLASELDAYKESQKAVGSFKRFFGKSAELDMIGMSIDEIERQSTQAEAEIEQFLDAIKPKLAEADLKKSADTDAAMAKFNAFVEQKSLPPAPSGPAIPVPTKQGVVVR